ncbi:beta strand repeat-containing protein [Bradyrhizobium ivorense]|uniref:beta strand repeat-containing protein n=1 Tax=Bradyrhizobium ivorense TaxID=2511166 RepID=UPI0010B3270C|nr:VCBS domain-containing protein [Bradyrhizobium ivorense]VIO77448.1 Serralysin G [Bradyrhizobium ivorense]
MTNHTPTFTSSSASGSFAEFANTTDSTTLHQLTGTMSFRDSDRSDTHTTSATLHSAVLSSGSIIPAASLAHFQTAMTSQITSDSNGAGSLKWTFSDPDDDFDFLSKNQSLVLTYDITVSDNHGGTAIQTVKVTVTGTDDKPVINMTTIATVTEQVDQTLSITPDTVHVALNFTDEDLTNTGHTATVIAASADGNTSGLLPGSLGTAELMSFYHVDNVIKTSGSSAGTINTTFAAPDLAFDYLAAGEHLDITYTVQLDDHAGGVSTQTVTVTVVGTNDKPVFLSPPEEAHLVEDQNVSPTGDLTAHGDLLFGDIDLFDAHTVSTTVTATRSGGGAIPLGDAALLAAFMTGLTPDSTGHLLGDVSWNFALPNADASFLSGGETLTLVYHVTVEDPSGATDTQDVTITILGTNHPVVITSAAESSTVSELADTTGSGTLDTTPTVPAGTLDFTDQDTADTHTVAVTLASTSGATVPAATQADLAAALTTTLHDSTGTGSGSIDWNFAIPDSDLDYLAAGETLTVNYDVKVSDNSTSSTQTVSVVITGANDAVAISSGPGSASLAEQPGVTDSGALDTAPTGTLDFTDVDLSDAHTVSVALNSATWSANPDFLPGDVFADLQGALATALHDSTGTGSGGVDWTFSIPDRDLDFLSLGETLTVSYDVTVSDGSTSSTQTVTITIDGASDTVVVTPTSVDISDSADRDAGNVLAAGSVIDLAHAVDLSSHRTIVDVNGSAANVGTAVAGTYGSLFLDSDGNYFYAANSAVDVLRDGDNVTDQFNFTVDDGQGHQTTTTLTFNIAGANDNPTATGGNVTGSVTEDAGPPVLVNGDFETGNLAGWTTTGTHIEVQQFELGGTFGHYSVHLAPTNVLETLAQDVATTPGQNYFITFDLLGDPETDNTPFTVTWDGITLLSLSSVPFGLNHYAFEVAGDATASSTSLQFTYADDANGMILDSVNVTAATSPPTESTSGTVSFADVETADTHTASFAPLDGGYVGTFTLDPVTETSGTGSVGWHFTVNTSDIQFLAQGQTLTQDYLVTVSDNHGGSVVQDVAVTLIGTNDAPTAVGETIVTDVDASGVVDIPAWALAANDTDPDTADHLFVNGVGSSSGGVAVFGGSDVFFFDDATPDGSFTYTSSDGVLTSNQATATVINNAVSATTLTGTGGDDIVIATNGTETLDGGAGNDVLIGNAGSHTMTGGSGNDIFAFLTTTDGPGAITDFNNTTEHDRVAISASGFGGSLSAGMDVSSTFETSGDDQFSGSGAQFHFDTANQTLYFSADGTQASAITVASVQAGVVLNPHDILVV